MKKFPLLLFFLMITVLSYSQGRKVVVKEHANGKPHIIYYMDGTGPKAVKIKEEGYYANGNMEYSGHVKNGVEHGEWRYYYENGNLRAIENWKNGREEGVWKEFHPDGQLAREVVYKNGKVIQTKK
jgi:antitoxin component YwqK of YwqJK toxin-antitoxin module